MLVALGAAAYTIAGSYGVTGLGSVHDAGRVAAQIVTGIGFIGAGTIWRSGTNEGLIRGLTTAASIWVAASIGMLAGFGLYVLAGGCAVASFVVLRTLRSVERSTQDLGRIRRRSSAGTQGTASGGRNPDGTRLLDAQHHRRATTAPAGLLRWRTRRGHERGRQRRQRE
jgi:uncharacterized membrane protein YhiD involved in acid resistance